MMTEGIRIDPGEVPDYAWDRMFRLIRAGVQRAREEPGYQERLEQFKKEKGVKAG